jgi:hypothetical protein
MTIEILDRKARGKTDMAAAEEMQKAKQKLFAGFDKRRSA